MAAYQTQQINVGSIAAPDVGKVFTDYAGTLNQYHQQGLDRAMKQAMFDSELGFKQRAEQRDIDRINKENQKELATNEAMRAVLDPKGYQQSKMAVEQKAVEDAYKLMRPEEVAAVKAQYDPAASGKQWLDVAQSAKGVDVGKVFDAKYRQYEIAAKTPGTPEYEAAKKAELDLYKIKANIDLGTKEAAARFENDLRQKYESQKAQGMYRVLEVGNTKPEEYVKNDALRKNVEAKQGIYGDTYKEEVDKVTPAIDTINKNTEALKARLTGNPELDKGLIASITANDSKLKTLYDRVHKTALGKSGMGNTFVEVPTAVKDTRNVVKSKSEYTSDVIKALGPNPSAEAIAIATQEINKRYPMVSQEASGWKAAILGQGGQVPDTNDVKVLEESYKTLVDKNKTLLEKGININQKKVAVDKTNEAVKDMFNKYGSPDVIGSGDEGDLLTKIYQIKAANELTDDQMSSIITQASPKYNGFAWMVNEGTSEDFVKELEEKAKALKGTTPSIK